MNANHSNSDCEGAAVTCPFCSGDHLRDGGTAIDENQRRFPQRVCLRCGTKFLSPAPSTEVLTHAYASSYYGEGETKFGGPIERFRDAAAAGRAKALVKSLPPRARALDVGCGDGRFLRLLGSLHHDLELHGIEMPGPAADRASRITGLVLHPGTLNSTTFDQDTFDIISLVHVIEHLPDPEAALVRVVRWLRPGGRLFLAFPNVQSWQAKLFSRHWFHLDPPRHLTLVPPGAVSARLTQLGLVPEAERHWCPEQNLFGWIQSALNACDPDRNLLYERLKRNKMYQAERVVAPTIHAAAAALLVMPAILLDLAATFCRSGATVELTFQKPQINHVS
jgi:2-polyprenyl-3-methyl-5-hydroxy-6-metoxy-1,4-benzoquinol methylase